ncbi:IclR family transcriptional regulator [Diaphorobacter sp. HDW4A]|uniref:IclR family transcriptional regulator n=1 Tax=Diaphorobacter sp. HDW4A TaxID=2714924 RepID=UPI00140C5ED6|nr:IclR family transcriptional regulator [Diaphorobacter sp. HDW4A]QIL79770.1 IclR family transcriptional regulator [Diaphorobacter sp. HDW4A]
MPQPTSHSEHTVDAQSDRRYVTALSRGLELLSCFRSGDKLLGNHDIARRCQLPKSTVSRLTYTLTALGYLRYVPRENKYRLGSASLALGSAMLFGLAVRQQARPLMQRLAAFTQSEVALATRDRHTMIYIEHCPSPKPHPRAQTLETGARVPLATTAIGRAWLAACPAHERNEAIAYLQNHATAQWQSLNHAQADERTAGGEAAQSIVSHSFGDWMPQVNGIAVAFDPGRGLPLMAMSCGGPHHDLPPSVLIDRAQPELLRVVQRLQSRFRQP